MLGSNALINKFLSTPTPQQPPPIINPATTTLLQLQNIEKGNGLFIRLLNNNNILFEQIKTENEERLKLMRSLDGLNEQMMNANAKIEKKLDTLLEKVSENSFKIDQSVKQQKLLEAIGKGVDVLICGASEERHDFIQENVSLKTKLNKNNQELQKLDTLLEKVSENSFKIDQSVKQKKLLEAIGKGVDVLICGASEERHDFIQENVSLKTKLNIKNQDLQKVTQENIELKRKLHEPGESPKKKKKQQNKTKTKVVEIDFGFDDMELEYSDSAKKLFEDEYNKQLSLMNESIK